MPHRPDAYGRIAALYDTALLALPRHVRQTLLHVCTQFAPQRILDIGCGTGTFAFTLAQSIPFVVGMDVSPAMLAKARKKLQQNIEKQTPTSPIFIQGSGLTPPFAPNSFDVVLFSLVLHETEDDAATMLKQALLLAPRVVILEWRMPERNLDYVTAPLMHLIERCAGKEHYRHFRTFMRTGGLHGLAHCAGAHIVSEQSLLFGAMVVATLEKIPT